MSDYQSSDDEFICDDDDGMPRKPRAQPVNKSRVSARKQTQPPPNIEEAQKTPKPQDINESGSLVYIFQGDQDPSEVAVFAKICMKYGLQAWEQMMMYLPWRNRAALRTALCRILMKQALSEYDGIRADPFLIQRDNKENLTGNPDYVMKSGMFINQQWDRTAEEWEEVRKKNYEKYNLSDEEANQIEIPTIISLEYMKQLCDNRRQSLLLVRAALRYELARRQAQLKGKKKPAHVDLGVEELIINPSETLNLPSYENPLEVNHNPNSLYFDIDN